MTADDDLELCQLAVVVIDNQPPTEGLEDGECVPIGVGKFDGEGK